MSYRPIATVSLNRAYAVEELFVAFERYLEASPLQKRVVSDRPPFWWDSYSAQKDICGTSCDGLHSLSFVGLLPLFALPDNRSLDTLLISHYSHNAAWELLIHWTPEMEVHDTLTRIHTLGPPNMDWILGVFKDITAKLPPYLV